jgi:predicted nuclease of predicted toxin-antitoxin system
MRLLADIHISPRTVQHLNELGHDVIRVGTIMPGTASDLEIVNQAEADDRAVLTQDLDFSDIIALSGAAQPSLITLRLSDSRVDNVNLILQSVLPELEADVSKGVIATVEDTRVRIRPLPVR